MSKNMNIIRKFGNWKIDIFEKKIRVSNNSYQVFPKFIDETTVACPVKDQEKLPKAIKDYLGNHSEKLYNLHNVLNSDRCANEENMQSIIYYFKRKHKYQNR